MSYNNNDSYKKYRDKVSMIAVLDELGYRAARGKGRGAPVMQLLDSNGNVIDEVVVFNPHNWAITNYWRRHSRPGFRDSGDVAQIIKDNITSYPELATARNVDDAVNKVLMRMSNTVVDEKYILNKPSLAYINKPIRPFHLQDFDRDKGNWQKAMRYFKERGIDEYTAQLFKDNYELIRDTRSDFKSHNLGFPYRRPGQADIVGYEIRGYGKYKSKAEGTDSTNACWIAYLGKLGTPERIPAHDIEYIHIAESAYDVMSYVQLHQGRLDFDRSIFVSVGGTFTNNMMNSLLTTYKDATPVLHFDNDITGVMYDIRTAAIKAGKTLRSTTANGEVVFYYGDKTITVPADNLSYAQFIKAANLHSEDRPKVKIEKAPGEFKDFNEILQTAMQAEKAQLKPVSKAPQRGSYDNPAPPPPEETDSRGFKR